MLCGVAGSVKVSTSNQVAKVQGNQVAVAGAFGEFKVPERPSPRIALKQKVLDEDTYTSALQRCGQDTVLVFLCLCHVFAWSMYELFQLFER